MTESHPAAVPALEPVQLKEALRRYAAGVGIGLLAVASAAPFQSERALLQERAVRGWLSPFEPSDIERRCNPDLLLPGAKSLIAIAVPYWRPDEESQPDEPRGWISRSGRGVDYHRVLREKLQQIADFLQRHFPDARSLICVDTAPPLDRAVAARAGLGFLGKHGSLITEPYGTWVFLGELLTTVELPPDPPVEMDCGRCRLCLDACPTGALVEPYVLDPARCISQVTQERGGIPFEFREAMGDRLYGCDTCQDVCPHNAAEPRRYARRQAARQAGGETAGVPDPSEPFEPFAAVTARPSLAQMLAMTKGQFKAWFAPSGAGWRGKTVLQRNAVIALGNAGDASAMPLLEQTLRQDSRPVLRGHAAWGLGRLVRRGRADAAAVAGILRGALAEETDTDVRKEIIQALDSL